MVNQVMSFSLKCKEGCVVEVMGLLKMINLSLMPLLLQLLTVELLLPQLGMEIWILTHQNAGKSLTEQ